MLDELSSECYYLDFHFVYSELHILKYYTQAILPTLKCSYDFLLNFKLDSTL